MILETGDCRVLVIHHGLKVVIVMVTADQSLVNLEIWLEHHRTVIPSLLLETFEEYIDKETSCVRH